MNRLEAEGRAGRQGRMDFVVLDGLGYLPFAQSSGQLLFHLISRLALMTEATKELSAGVDVLDPRQAAG